MEQVKLEEVERVSKLIKPLKEVVNLGAWMIQVAYVIAKVPNLKNERDLLEVIVGEKILDEEMKRWFLRGNKNDEGGLTALERYLQLDHVRDQINKEERKCVQEDVTNNNKMFLVDYVEKKYDLLLAKEARFRDKEKESWKEIYPLIKGDMSAEDVLLLGPLNTFASKDALVEACEVYSAIDRQAREKKNKLAAVKAEEEVKEKEGEERRRPAKMRDFGKKKKEFSKKNVECDWCKKKGHQEDDCWSKKRGEPKLVVNGDSYGKEIICFYCHEKGHVVKNCPKLGMGKERRKNKRKRKNEVLKKRKK